MKNAKNNYPVPTYVFKKLLSYVAWDHVNLADYLWSLRANLRSEYMRKLVDAREALQEETRSLATKRAGQEARLAKLQAAKTDLRENAERLSEKYEDIKVGQQFILLGIAVIAVSSILPVLICIELFVKNFYADVPISE